MAVVVLHLINVSVPRAILDATVRQVSLNNAGIFVHHIAHLITQYDLECFYLYVLCYYFSLALCTDDCLHGGTCGSSGVCLCTSRYSGDKCEIK